MEYKRFKFNDIFDIDSNGTPKLFDPKTATGEESHKIRVNVTGHRPVMRTGKVVTHREKYIIANKLGRKAATIQNSKMITPRRVANIFRRNEGTLRSNEKHIFLLQPVNVSPRVPVKIGEISMGPGVHISAKESFSGINLAKIAGHDISGYIENGVLIIKGYYK